MRMLLIGAVGVLLVSFAGAVDADGKRGYWCWTHQDGDTGACAPLEEQCKASLEGFNQTAAAFREPPVSGTCTWQKAAWQLITKPAPKPPRYFPTKKMCTSGLAKGDRCKEVR